MNRPLVDKLTLCRVLWRSFFLQAAWNYQGQQSLGLAAAMSAALEKIHGRGTEAFNQALADYLEPFNTQPPHERSDSGRPCQVRGRGPGGRAGPGSGPAVQDGHERGPGGHRRRLFLERPSSRPRPRWGFFFAVEGHPAGAVFFLVLFNLAHAPLRIWGFFAGYGQGLGIVSALDKLHLPLAAQRLKVGRRRRPRADGRLVPDQGWVRIYGGRPNF